MVQLLSVKRNGCHAAPVHYHTLIVFLVFCGQFVFGVISKNFNEEIKHYWDNIFFSLLSPYKIYSFSILIFFDSNYIDLLNVWHIKQVGIMCFIQIDIITTKISTLTWTKKYLYCTLYNANHKQFDRHVHFLLILFLSFLLFCLLIKSNKYTIVSENGNEM